MLRNERTGLAEHEAGPSDQAAAASEIDADVTGELSIPASTGLYSAHAHRYRKAGWPGVLPVPPRTKKLSADLAGYTGHNGVDPSGADVQTWSDNGKAHWNIALRLPDWLIGIDVDWYKTSGRATWERLTTELSALPTTWRSSARVDGVSGIIWFRVPPGLSFKGQLGEGVEIIQRGHRYAMAPPSIHPDGEQYCWYRPDGSLSYGEIPSTDTFPDLPADWLAAAVRPAIETAKADMGSEEIIEWVKNLPGAHEDPACSLLRGESYRLVKKIRQAAGRHDTMRDGVLALLRLSVEGHRGIVVELGTVRLAFIGSVTQRGEGQRSLGEAQGEWQRALDGAVRLVRRNTEEIELRDPCRPPFSAELLAEGAERHNIERLTSTSALVIDEEGNDVTDDTLRLIRLDEFLSTPDSPVKYRVDRLLCVGAKVLLVAQWKAGKSTTVGNLTRSLVDEVPFLGEFAVEPFTGSVVVIDDELSEGQLRRWLREQGIRNTQRVHVMPLRGRAERFNLLDPEVMDRWVSMLQEVDCAVLIFDCLRPVLDAIGLSEDKEAGRFVEALSTLLYRADVGESVIVHHMGHNGERARGDSSLRGKTDAEWKMVRAVGTDDAGREVDDPSAPRFFSAFGRDVDVPEGALEYDEPARRLTYLGGNRKEVKIRSVLISVLEYVKDHQPVNKGEIEKALGGDNKVVRSAMADGIKDGLLAESRQGTAKPLSLTQDGYAYISRFGVPVVLGGDHAPESLVGFGVPPIGGTEHRTPTPEVASRPGGLRPTENRELPYGEGLDPADDPGAE